MAHVASQRFFTKNYMFVFVSIMFGFFHIFSNSKRRALKFREDWSNFQPVNSDLRPFRAFLDADGTKTAPAQVEVCLIQTTKELSKNGRRQKGGGPRRTQT